MIAFVESPLQLKNFSNIYTGNNDEFVLFVRLNGDKKNDDLLIGSTFPKNIKVKYILMRKGSLPHLFKGFTLSIFIGLLSKCFFDEVYIGDWRSKWMRYAAYIISPFKVNVLDDGFATINTIKHLNNKASFVRGKLKNHYQKILKLFPKFYSNFHIESEYIEVFHCPRTPRDSGKVLKNNAFFIGSPLFDKGILSKEYTLVLYQRTIKDVALLAEEVIYIPHRSESNRWLSMLSSNFPQIKVIEPDCAVEEYLDSLPYTPSVIFSFYSTALYNLQFMSRDNRVISYLIDEEQLLSNKTEIFQVYEYLDKFTTVEVRKVESYTQD